MVGLRPHGGTIGRFRVPWRDGEHLDDVDRRRDEFAALAGARFGFLTEEAGFVGPELLASGLAYHSPRLQIDVLFDDREKAIVTVARALIDDLNVRAELSCLYATSGLGPVQDVKTTARTGHTLQRSMASQAEAMRKLLPTLLGRGRDSLMKACHAR
jgi:hypothetical protein